MHKTGAFNICCKLFVSLDILFEMRSHIQQGEPVHNCAHSLMEAASLTGERLPLTSQEQWYLERMLYDGYFAFEAMTARKWDDGVCGICGIAPVFESGDGNAKNCTPLKKGQVYFLYTSFCSFLFHFLLIIDINF